MAVVRSSLVRPNDCSFFISGITTTSGFAKPLMSANATSGNCSMRFLSTVSVKSLSSRNFSSEYSPLRVTTKFKIGISLAEALMILGLSKSRGKKLSAASIFSLVSIKAKSVLVPYSKLRRIVAQPSRVSDSTSFRLEICSN